MSRAHVHARSGDVAARKASCRSQGIVGLVTLAVLTAVAVVGPAPGAPPASAAGTTLYVAPDGSDANPGTATRPLRTISQAASLATPGTTVNVAAGDYRDHVVTDVSGTATAHVRFVSTTGWGARIRTSGAEQAWLNLGNYVDIVGFDISAPDARMGIQNEASHVLTERNHVHDVAARLNAAGCNHNGGAGIVNANPAMGDNEISANVVHDIGNSTDARVSASCWTVHGIYDAAPRGKVFNNIAYRNEAFGIHLWHAATGNVVSNNLSFSNGLGGIQVGAGDAPGGVTADNYVISNNIVLDNPQFGIHASGSLGSHNRYLNNLLARNGSAYAGVSEGISGTLTADPQFVNYQRNGFAAGGNYHLQAGSPAIGAGVSAGAPAQDFDGVARTSPAGIDIGPYQLGGSARTAPAVTSAPVATTPATATPVSTSTPTPRVPALSGAAASASSTSSLRPTPKDDVATPLGGIKPNRSDDGATWLCCRSVTTYGATDASASAGSSSGQTYQYRVRAGGGVGDPAHALTAPTTLAATATSTTPPPSISLYVAPTGSDDNPGTAAQPFRTIQRAARVAQPGTTVHVAPGRYAGPIHTSTSGTETARIRYVSDTRWGAKITSSDSRSVWKNTGNYVDIQDFDVSSVDARIGIVNASTIGYVRIIGNHVHDLGGADCTRESGAAILQDYSYGAQYSDTIGNLVERIGPTSNCDTIQGIAHSLPGGRVQDNIVHHVSGFAIRLWKAANGVTASNNLVFSNLGGGINVGDSDAPSEIIADNLIVTNNIVMDNPVGISEAEHPGAVTIGANNKYANNLVYRNETNLSLVTGVPLGTLSTDPGMLNYRPDGSGDYHLAPTSPVLDAGTGLGAPTADFDYAPRPQGAGFDIGPYEVAASPSPNTNTDTNTNTSTPAPLVQAAASGATVSVPAPSTPPATVYTTSISPIAVAPGQTVSISPSVTSSEASTALVDVEVYSPSGAKVFQHYWDNQAFGAGQPRTFSARWQVPTTAALGKYRVVVGIFSAGWSTVSSWNDSAGVASVTRNR